MMRLELIQGMQIIIISLMSYIPTVTITGWFEAWVAKKSGDDVPEQFGFLTLDPMAHFNLVGFGFLLVGQLFGNYLPFFKDIPGWGRYMPLNPSEHSRGNVVLQFLARSIAHFILIIFAFFSFVFISKNYELLGISANSSLFESVRDVLIFFYRQNFILFIIYFVIGLFRSILFFYFPSFHMLTTQQMIKAFVLLLLFVSIGSPIVEFLLANMMGFLNHLFMAK
ncbi:MAG: hypothetical protein NTU89_02390 [Candidatus Dependentiae bacterium]|nr:hypothetical protein [Candidatus Dependentiae bacterium]